MHHLRAATGVEWNVPRQHSQHQYYSTVELGETKMSPQDVGAVLESLAERWPGGAYDLIHHNCCQSHKYRNHYCRTGHWALDPEVT